MLISRVEIRIYYFFGRKSSVNRDGRKSRLSSRNDVVATAGNFETEHAQFNRRRDAFHLNESRPLIANLNSAARDTLRCRNLRCKFVVDLKQSQVSYGGVVYLWRRIQIGN